MSRVSIFRTHLERAREAAVEAAADAEIRRRLRPIMVALSRRVVTHLGSQGRCDTRRVTDDDWEFLATNVLFYYGQFTGDPIDFSDWLIWSRLTDGKRTARLCLRMQGHTDLADLTLDDWKWLVIAVAEQWTSRVIGGRMKQITL